MPTTLLSVLARLSAGALVLQAGVPAALPLKQGLDAPAAKRDALAAARARAALPPRPMKGVPTMEARPAAPRFAPPGRALPRAEGTILNEVGRTDAPVADARRAAWREAAGVPGPGAAWSRLWLAEADLAREYPQKAVERIDALLRSGPPARLAGLARYDRAECLFAMGRWGEARHAFAALLEGGARGFPRHDAAMWLAHARACEGYHLANERLGVPNPLRLDPMCGASAVAVCLRALGLPHGEALLAGAVRHTGEGSSLQDLADACARLGVAANPVRATERGLRSLPLPAVAHVEGDHFVAVVEADARGVEYVCSDCGAWPGGPVRVSWRAWRAMKPGVFLAVTRRGSLARAALEAVAPAASAGRPQSEAVAVSAGVTQGRLAGEAGRLAARLAGVTPLYLPVAIYYCGLKPEALHCPGGPGCGGDGLGPACPYDSGGASGVGASGGDPVNLATGEEEYHPGADLAVYNPKGPSVVWARTYESLSNRSSGLGFGWSHPYGLGVSMYPRAQGLPPNGQPFPRAGTVVLENNARIDFTTPDTPTAARPVVVCSPPQGVRMGIVWRYDAASDKDTFEVTLGDRTKWTTGDIAATSAELPSGQSAFRPIRSLQDRMGNAIGFLYTPVSAATGYDTNVQFSALSLIVDSAGSPLLTLNYDAHGFMNWVADRYGRYVYYTTKSYPTFAPSPQPGDRKSYQELTQVSQVTTSTVPSDVPVRYQYGYDTGGYAVDRGDVAPYLNTIAVPSPTGSGLATARIDYDLNSGFVTKTTDGNGNTRSYGATDATGASSSSYTTVKVRDPGGNLVRQFTYGLDSTMGWTTLQNAAGQTVATKSYGSGGAVYKPSSVTDGNNRTWSFTYDSFGTRLTATTPKGTVTTNTYAYGAFLLGELTSVTEGTKTGTSFHYDEPSGLVNEVDAPVPGDAGTGSTQATMYQHDALGNLTKVTAPGDDGSATHTTTYGYTTDGSTTQAEGLGHPLTVTDTNNKVWHRRYDARGNLSQAWDPLGVEWDTDHDVADRPTVEYAPATGNTGSGQSTTVTTYLYPGGPATQAVAKDESGATFRTVTYGYGPEGETLSRTGSAEAVSMAYDAAYEVKTLTDGNGHATTYTYDASGRAASISYPGATGANYDRVLFTSYDAAGNLLSRTDGVGQVASYTYADGDGLCDTVKYAGATGQDLSFSYDGYGRATSGTDAAGSWSTAYDDLGNATSATRTYAGLAAQASSYTYYPDGARRTMANVAGTWTYLHDGDGRYASMTSPAGTSSATYGDNGWEATRTLPNGVGTNYLYDAAGDPYQVYTHTAGGAAIASYGSFVYDGAFNLTGMSAYVPSATAGTGSTGYRYDAKDRLTSEGSSRAGGYSFSNAYDGAGNATTLRGEAGRTYTSDNGLVRTDVGSTYDGNGNPTLYNFAQSYDAEGRLAYEARADGSAAFTAGYRADGLRAWKGDGSGARTYYLYDGGEPVVELSASGSVTAVNAFAPDGLVGRKSGGAWTYYAFDQQGSAAQRLDAAGNVLSASVYDAFGRASTVGSWDDPFGYDARDGYYRDRESEYYLCRNRYYDPIGRWVTRDPVGYAGGINLYGYCGEGPVGADDPEGLRVYIVGSDGGPPDPHDENEIRRQLKRIGAPGSPLQQMMYDLITDCDPHYISAAYGGGTTDADKDGWFNHTRYNPWHDRPPPHPTGDNGSYIPYPPDVTLAHELGHQDSSARRRKRGKNDPGADPRDPYSKGVTGTRAQAGDNVADVENPYRKWRGLPRRATY